MCIFRRNPGVGRPHGILDYEHTEICTSASHRRQARVNLPLMLAQIRRGWQASARSRFAS
jgi:hypothetical protein